MYNYHLFVLCVLSAISFSFADDLHPGVENPNPHVSFTTYPPGIPTSIPEPTHKLSPGQRYAVPGHNPFYRPNALVYGPPKVAKFKEFTPLPPVFFNQTCHKGGGTVEERWRKHHPHVLHSNGTVQPIGFSLDIIKELELRNSTILGEITRGHQLIYTPKKHPNDTKRDLDDLDKRFVYQPDNRVEILNTWIFPFDTVGRVGSGCTGTLVGPHHVLTAGHCVHSGGPGGNWFSNLDFTLTYRPGFGGQAISTRTFAWAQVWSVTGWVDDGDLDYDYALIILQDTTTSFPWMSFGYNTDLDNGWIVNVNGFPGDKPPNTMWLTNGVITNTADQYFDATVDVVIDGDSGSAVYAYWSPSTRIIYGVISNEWWEEVPNFPDVWNSHTIFGNRATRINKTRFYLICSWIDSGVC